VLIRERMSRRDVGPPWTVTACCATQGQAREADCSALMPGGSDELAICLTRYRTGHVVAEVGAALLPKSHLNFNRFHSRRVAMTVLPPAQASASNSTNAGDEDRQRHIHPDIWKFKWHWAAPVLLATS